MPRPDQRKTHAALSEDPEPRTADLIAAITRQRLDSVLYQLRNLEAQGQIRHKVDEHGVMRWVMVEPEEVKPGLIPLGAMVLHTNRHYDLTPALKAALGL